MEEPTLNTYSTMALAYLGDSVIELCVRDLLVKRGISSSAKLNKTALEYVRASRQARAMERILPVLSEEEAAVFRRGRNIGHTNTPKSATVAEYRSATGMEALFGWLHLAGRQERIRELFLLAYENETEKPE
jgi:ribonuclease-3 family protein